MSPLNSTFLKNGNIVHPEFFLSGLVGIPFINYYYIFLGFVYAVSVLGNTLIMFLIYTDHCLHSPKYIAIFNLAVSDIGGSTALIPQMIDTFLFKSNVISYEACLTNMFFVLGFLTMQSFTLTVLSYDRYVAICFPLRYNVIVTNKSMLIIIAVLWIIAAVVNFIAVIFISMLSFCKSVVIDSYFCDHESMRHMACNDNTPSSVIRWIHSVLLFWFPSLLITGQYICIAIALLKFTALERLKAMQTCTSHLILVSIFYVPLSFSSSLGPFFQQNVWILNQSLSTAMPPMLNPIIYSLKTEELIQSLKKLYRKTVRTLY